MNDEYLELSHSNENTQFHGETFTEKAYDSEAVRKVYNGGESTPSFFEQKEVPGISRNSERIYKNRKQAEGLMMELSSNPAYRKTERRIVLPQSGQSQSRLKHTDTPQILSEREYRSRVGRKRQTAMKYRLERRALYAKGKKLLDDNSIPEDEEIADAKKRLKHAAHTTAYSFRRNVHNIQDNNNIYQRLKFKNENVELLTKKNERLIGKANRRTEKADLKSVSSKQERKKIEQRMRNERRMQEGNFFQRSGRQLNLIKKKTAHQIRTVRRITTTAFSIGGIILILLILILFIFLIIMGIVSGGSEYAASTVTQNDYGVLSESTSYLRSLEVDLEEYVSNTDVLEEDIITQAGTDIYEFHYNICAFGFDGRILMAYLSAKYGSYTLEDVKETIESIFKEMYQMKIEIQEEWRDILNPETGETSRELKNICYVTVTKKELKDVVEGRLTENEKKQYETYIISSGGQQVYGPVMERDWTNLISSDYGARIHPITKERTFHNGVDIAIPVGTKLYSAVSGKVILAQYSNTAGNYMKVQTDSGWTVVFMHMDSITVRVGDMVKRGDFVGYSGNTGRSTGPHLHLEVRDSQNNTVNPLFIVPQTCADITD